MSNMQKQVVKVNNVKFNNGVIGAIHFVATKRGKVRCVPIGKSVADLPTIRVTRFEDAEFEASIKFPEGERWSITARTPDKAFRKAVIAFWSN